MVYSHRRTRLGDASPRVLLAEDDEVVRLLLEKCLHGWGYQVVAVKNGIEAWEILRQDAPPELVILDWKMPGIDGIELCGRVRHGLSDFYHYVLLITGKSHKKNAAQALESGADDFLTKPFDLSELQSKLKVATRILSLQDRLIQAREDLRDQATKDGLTGLWNRVTFLDLFQRELGRAARSKATTGLLLIDLDHFKQVNDTHGHLAGDLVLKRVAGRLKNVLRSYDFVGRFGGEEFLIALPDTSRNHLCNIAERIRLSVANLAVHYGGAKIKFSLSVGAIEVMPGEMSSLDAIAVADVALYHAKNSGRNCTVYCQRPWQELLSSEGACRAICNECHVELLKQCVVSAAGKGTENLPGSRVSWLMYPYKTEVSYEERAII
jgi:diguanylate cyclase (GGDEF)-like protein